MPILAFAPVARNVPASEDLGPLAWVIEEIQKSIDITGKSLRRFVHESSAGPEVDTGPLRLARQQLHQAVGALQMVGQAAPALVLGAMEFAVQGFAQEPARCTDAAIQKIDRAGFAVSDFLNARLSGKAASSVALFPQYRDVLELVGNERVHPADLWSKPWRWVDIALPSARPALVYDPAVRSRLDREVLQVVKSGDDEAARRLQEICVGLSRGAASARVASFWALAAGFFEALALSLLPADVYVKRAASRMLLQYATLARGDNTVSDRLAQDLLFFCAQAVPGSRDEASTLRAVRVAWGIADERAIDYTSEQFGRFDPVVLARARKRIEAAKEMWSALSGGDLEHLRQVADTFAQLSESLQQLHPPSLPMAQALVNAVEASLQSGQPPATELAMEVATSVLYLEAAFEDLDPHDRQLTARTVQLAGRIERARAGGRSEPLEPWMEELYRRVSDRQTMGTVVDELRSHLAELEKSLDQFFRRPQEKGLLRTVPTQLLQMRGVFSVLGLEQAAQAVQRMRDNVDSLLAGESSVEEARDFDALGNNLGALGFLIDMLGYQPVLAKRLFVFDEAAGELKPLMGRQAAEAEAPSAVTVASASTAAPAPTHTVLTVEEVDAQIAARLAALAAPHRNKVSSPIEEFSRAADSWTAKITGPGPLEALPDTEVTELEEDDLQNIFLEEAREVLHGGLAAVAALKRDATHLGELTVLRRAFHTLKGSSRMVGLTDFGEAAWSFEQVLNTWLADQRPATPALLVATDNALRDFANWVEAIAAAEPHAWQAQTFRTAAEALRGAEPALPVVPVLGADALAIAARHIADEPVPSAPAAALLPELPSLDFPATAFEPPAFDAPAFDAPAARPVQPRSDAPAPPFADRDADAMPPPSLLREPDEGSVDAFPSTDFLDFDEPVAPVRADAGAPADAEIIDFLAAMQASTDPAFEAPAQPAPEAAAEPEPIVAVAQPVPAEVAPALMLVEAASGSGPELPAQSGADEAVKVIGPLRIGVALYNVYLNEADEWSRQLANEIGEWALESHLPMPESTVGLAHSLAGSSATVGFQSLSGMARLLETALQHLHLQGGGTPVQGTVLVAAADELRRLLHQFAAGFLKEPAPETLQALRDLAAAPMPAEWVEAVPAAPAQPEDTIEDAPAEQAGPEAAAPVAEPPAEAPREVISMPAVADEPAVYDATEDAIDLVDAVDADLFPVFEEEASELLPQLGTALREWQQQPGSAMPRASTLRTLHTLKGSARLAGAMRLGERAHRMESEIERLGSEGVERSAIDRLLARFDVLQATFDGLRAADAAVQAQIAQRAAEATAQARLGPLETPAAAAAIVPAGLPVDEPSDVPAVEAAGAPADKPALPTPAALVPPRQGASQAVRIRTQLLDRLVAQAGEVIITRSRLEAELGQLRSSLSDLTGNLDRLRQQLRDIEVQAESQMQSRLAQAKDSQQGFDPLEFDRFTRVQELTRMMAESVNDVATVQRTLQRTVQSTEDDLSAQARQTRELQRGLLRTRMVEFEELSERLYRVVRQASKDTGKPVRLDISGGRIEMDRGVLDRMTPAFEHLLRNCVAHGIEPAALREQAGKEASGLISIDLHHEGNDVSVSFRDDGAGLDQARIAERAVALGLIAPGQQPTPEEAAQLIFRPGFSTATQVSELAGRGIGMDVVRSEVASVGGRIETHSSPGQGTTFKLVLPLTTAVTHVVMLRAGEVSLGVPSGLVELVQRVGASDLEAAYRDQAYAFGGERLPFFWAGALLQASARSERGAARTNFVVVVRSAAQRLALHVDEVLGNQEVVIKNLGPQLARLPGMAGISVLASGAVALIYNPVALAAVHGEQARRLQSSAAIGATGGTGADAGAPVAAEAPTPSQVPLVLVVDDSITVRRVTQRLLQREGYRVALAADGLQALERLQQERPAVVLSDIEMPRMDGFDLARNIRADAALAALPIIMITSRIAEKHREHAKQLGVNHYLGKPYSEEELLRLVRSFIQAPALAAAA